MLLIYTPHITNRFKYVMQYVFEERMGIDYSLTNSIEEYINSNEKYKIAYAIEHCSSGLYFFAKDLLFEEDIKEISLEHSFISDVVVFFKHNKNAALTFDVFAAIFYLLSRYEEYLNTTLDKHENYDCSNSILFKLNILNIPVVEQWIELLKEVLAANFPSLQFKKHIATCLPSFDVDVAYAYKGKNIFRTVSLFAKNLFTLKFPELKRLVKGLSNKEKDVYDTYDYIFASIKNKKSIFFFDMGRYGKFDKNPSHANKLFRLLIKQVADKAIVGLHPSYTSNNNKALVAVEKNKLEKIIQKTITASRQHYLKLKLPHTYTNLISNNIYEDFTLGYSAQYGFRAGTCNSFLFFNLITNQSTDLRLYPFSYMDVTLNNYLNLTITDAKKIISELIHTVAKHNGIFIPLWHNSTLSDCYEWKNWREVFEHTLQELDNYNFKNLLH